jgi:cyclophilin family peptidyl-prolyl cis-trans isomerase
MGRYGPPPAPHGWKHQSTEATVVPRAFAWQFSSGQTSVRVPHWLLVVSCLAIGCVAWIRRRFGLRTLLVAITLISCLLGFMIWVLRSDDMPSVSANPAAADESPAQAVPDKTADASSEAFRKKLAEWVKLRDQLQVILTKSQKPVSPAEFRSLEEAGRPIMKQMVASAPEVTRLAEAAWLGEPGADLEAFEWLEGAMGGALQSGRYLEAARLGKVISDREERLNAAQRRNALTGAAMASFNANQFDLCKTQLEVFQKAGPLDIGKADKLALNKQYIARWRAEQEIRARESRSKHLPRVKLQTNKGDVVIELFKDDAPETVAGFISIVEAHKLNDVPLKKISDGMVKALQISADDSPLESPKAEVSRKSSRLHFHGSLSVGKFDSSAGTKIVVSLQPVPEWDAKNSVFGRVVEGMSTVEEILHVVVMLDGEKRNGRSIQATVLRK